MAIDYYFSNRKKNKKDAKHAPTPPRFYAQNEEKKPKVIIIDYKRLTWVIALFAFALIVWWLLISPTFIVKDIVYEQEVSDKIKNRVESLKGKNILLLQLGKLGTEWQKEQPVIKKLIIYRGLPHTLRVNIEERSKAMVWKSGDNYYILDATGVAYEDAGKDMKENYMPIIDDNLVAVSLGNKIVSADFVSSVQNIFDNIEGKTGDETVKEMHVGESTFNVTVVTSKDVKIKFDITQPLDLQLEALDYIYKEKRSDVKEYIDVRVIGKAYIK